MAKLELRGVVKRFGTNTVCNGIDLDVDEGQMVCLIGASGAGKSTLLRCIKQKQINVFSHEMTLTVKWQMGRNQLMHPLAVVGSTIGVMNKTDAVLHTAGGGDVIDDAIGMANGAESVCNHQSSDRQLFQAPCNHSLTMVVKSTGGLIKNQKTRFAH